MLFWFTESLFSPLIADTNLTIWRGGKKKQNKTNQTKPKEEREALASALWNSSHTPPCLSFVPLSVMLRNRRPLKSALMRPKRHSSLLSPLPWSFWRSGFGSHTHTQPHQYRPTRSWRTGCIRVVSAATLVPAFGRLLKFSGGLWVGLVVTARSIFLNFFLFFTFPFPWEANKWWVWSPQLQCRPAGSVVRGPNSSRFNLKPQEPVADSPGRKAEPDGQTISWAFDTSRFYDLDLDNFDTSGFS